MSKYHFSADQVTLGRAKIPFAHLMFHELGAPVTLDADGLIAAATSSELPNNDTITYTTADDGASPIDNVATPAPQGLVYQGTIVSVWALDVPRNITLAVTHGSSVVAMSVTITGYDEYKERMTETLSVTAGDTSKNAAGKKAFKYIESYAFASAGNATANTANLGWGNVLGLPAKLASVGHLVSFGAPTDELASATIAIVDSSAATATTGDVRGAVTPVTACNGTLKYYATMVVDASSEEAARGVAQYGG